MKSIELFGPTIVAGEVRHAYENPITVSNREALRLKTSGVLASDPVDAPGYDPVEDPVVESSSEDDHEPQA
jgi:hypothetical protein